MSEHYTKNTESATAWCPRCGRNTEHRVDSGRKGPCIDPAHPVPMVRAQIPPLDLPKPPEQKSLFGTEREAPGKGRSRGKEEEK
jgi:hypothetical protein